MATPSSANQPTTGELLAAIVQDHEKRIRQIERIAYTLAGAATGSTGMWISIHLMTGR